MNPQITDVFKSLVLEYKNRSEDTVKKITSLLSKSGLLDRLERLITDSSIPMECVSNVCTILTQAVATQVPHLQDLIMFQVVNVLRYYLTEELVGQENLRLTYVGDFCVCCLSFMMQRCLGLYLSGQKKLEKLPYDTIQKRNAVAFTARTDVASIEPLDVPEIDAFERQALPIFRQCLQELEERLVPRYEQLRAKAGNMFGFSTFSLLRLVARIFAISADLKNVVFKQVSMNNRESMDWLGAQRVEEPAGPGMALPAQDDAYARLGESAHAGCGGPSNVDILSTFMVGNISIKISVPTVIRTILKTNLIPTLI